MSPLAIAILAFSMSADACAAAMARGAFTRPTFVQAIKSGLIFGSIEAVTPVLGWTIGVVASKYIAAIDHWVAFTLLSAVGGKMVLESLKRLSGPDVREEQPRASGVIALVITAFATSIDAAVVGATLALVDLNILYVALAIGSTTFALATAGLLVGRAVGARLGPIVETVGGLGLIAIGTVILLEHVGIG